MAEKKYDTTLARIAGNIAAGLVGSREWPVEQIADTAVTIARAIVDELTPAPAKPHPEPVLPPTYHPAHSWLFCGCGALAHPDDHCSICLLPRAEHSDDGANP